MKLKNNKVKLILSFSVDDKWKFDEMLEKEHSFSIVDTETLRINTKSDSMLVHLKHLNEKDRNCLNFLRSIKDLNKLQIQYEVKHDKLEVSFFTVRLEEEEFDKELFAKSISVTDVDSKVLIGLFLDNRFHG